MSSAEQMPIAFDQEKQKDHGHEVKDCDRRCSGLLSASPAFAQSFDPSDGTGNELPSYYGPHGGLHAGIVPRNQTAAHQSGLNAFASVNGIASDTSFETSGGSRG
jgi:hypothetical protein